MAELGPTTIYGELIVKGDLTFNDTNTQIWEDTSGNLTFKDANAGTFYLQQLAIRKAYCTEDAPTQGSVIEAELDDVGGTAIRVFCQIVGQNPSAQEDLSQSVPRLENGDEIYVYFDGKNWNCITLFNQSTESISLDNLDDVTILNPSNGETLTYSSAAGKWINS